MSQLPILLSLLAIGKIHGQEVIIPQIINVQFLPPPDPLDGRTQPIIVVPDQNWHYGAIQSGGLQNPLQRASYTDRLTPFQSDNSHLSSPTVREETLQQEFPAQKQDKMSQPATNGSSANTSQNNSVNDRVNMEENVPKPVSKKQHPQVPETNHTATAANETLVLPPVVNVTAVNPATNETVFQPVDKNGTKVTFDERSSFDGDKCPTGYVRVNGKCVETD